ncbi:MAG: HAD-IA family hydrolase [Endomicrobium sp.]|jgi:phosphoglycolate phosphatase|nr:HAD-IA family hydrolase [Endomicrobium sp.]
MSFDFLIFDLDGTLVDSQYDITLCINLVRKEYGFNALSVEQVRSYLGDGINVLMNKVMSEKAGVNMNKIVEKFKFYYKQNLTKTTVMYEGVREMLEALRDKKKAILSNKNENFCKKIVEVLGISSYFVQIRGGDSIDVKKPNPKTVLDLVKLTNSDISKTIMIGDSVNDFLVAKSAGVLSMAVSYGYSNVKCFKKYSPNYIVKTAKDIVDIVL